MEVFTLGFCSIPFSGKTGAYLSVYSWESYLTTMSQSSSQDCLWGPLIYWTLCGVCRPVSRLVSFWINLLVRVLIPALCLAHIHLTVLCSFWLWSVCGLPCVFIGTVSCVLSPHCIEHPYTVFYRFLPKLVPESPWVLLTSRTSFVLERTSEIHASVLRSGVVWPVWVQDGHAADWGMRSGLFMWDCFIQFCSNEGTLISPMRWNFLCSLISMLFLWVVRQYSLSTVVLTCLWKTMSSKNCYYVTMKGSLLWLSWAANLKEPRVSLDKRLYSKIA